jgi:cytochrome c-type biogenesis protein
LWLAIAVSALVGLISFLSPCVLPLIPGYLSYVTGLAGRATESEPDVADGVDPSAVGAPASGSAVAEATRRDSHVVLGAGLFVAGFTVVFVSYGALFGGLGRLLLEWTPVLNRVFGVVTILMGLAFLGLFPGLQRGSASFHEPVWPVPHCWASCSGSGGHRAWDRPSGRSTPWP